MKKLIIAGFGQPLLDLFDFLSDRFEIVGVILDYERKSKHPWFHEALAAKSIQVYTFEDVARLKPDAIVVFNYNKIINVSDKIVPILNIHLGLLPVYRGNNANAWSILNGDRKVGYTLHEVTDTLDGGAIYYKFTYEISINETYFHAKKAMTADLKNELPLVIDKVLNHEILGVDQTNEDFVYASKLYPEDGILSHWDYTTEEIISRNMIFARPLGTGLKMLHNSKIIEISKLSMVPHYKISKGFPGAVVMKNDTGSVWIKTKDTAISIDELFIDEQIVLPSTLFKIGERL
jgi:methionyl-tRNA formyltransferase